MAEAIHERTIAVLDQAERRFLALPKSRRKRPPPDWYEIAHDAEAAAGEAKEAAYLKVAATPASTRAGQALKLRLLAQAYGMSLDDPPLRSWVLIRSLAKDLRGDDHHLLLELNVSAVVARSTLHEMFSELEGAI